MPWKEIDPMTEKERFVHLALSGKFAISELCDQHGISRKTGHKYINRYKAQGRDGLVERSRRPKTYANASDADIIRLILLEKRKHPNWGGRAGSERGQSRMARTLGVCSSICIEVYIKFYIDILVGDIHNSVCVK